MSDERIDIEITDKVSPEIANKITAIAFASRDADSAVSKLKANLAAINTAPLQRLQGALSDNASALSKNAIANQKLNTEMQRTSSASAIAQAAQVRVTTAQTQGATAAQRLATEQKKTAVATAQAEAANSRAALAALRLKNAQEAAAGGANKHSNSLMKFAQSALMIVGTAVGVIALVGALGKAGDAYTNLQNKLVVVADSEQALATITEKVFEIANRTRTPVQETAQAFARFDMAMKNLGASQEESLRMTETINKSLVVSGATSSEAASGLLQLSQAFNKGKLDGDEFRSVMELMPLAANAIAKQLKVTRGELLRLAPEGKITAEVMRKAFAAAAIDIDAKFAKTVPTVGQAFTVFKNSATKFFGELNKSLGITTSLASGILTLSNNMNLLGMGLAVVASMLLVAFGPALISLLGAATGAVVTFTLALASNPLGLLVVGITSAIAFIALFGDKLKVTEDGLISLKDVGLSVFSFMSDGFSVLVSYIGDLWNGLIDMVNSKTDGWAERFRDFSGFVLGVMKTTVNEIIGFWVGAYNVIKNKWDFNDVGASIEKAFGDAFSVDYVGNAVDAVKKRAGDIAKVRRELEASSGGGLRGSGPAEKLVDPKALKAAERRSMAMDKINSQLDKETRGLFVLKPARETQAKLDQIEINLASKKMKLTDGEREALTEKLKVLEEAKYVQQAFDSIYETAIGPKRDYNAQLVAADKLLKSGAISQVQYSRAIVMATEAYKNAADPMYAINKEMKEQQQILSKVGSQQEIEQQLIQYKNQLLQKGVVLNEQETLGLQSKLTALQQQKQIGDEINKLYSETQGKQVSLQQQAVALNAAYATGNLSLDQYKNRLTQLTVAMANAKLQAGNGTFDDAVTGSLGKMVAQYDGVLSGLSDSFGNFFTTLEDGFANSIGRAVVYSENLGDALNNVAKEALAGLISGLVKLGIQYVINAALGQSIGATALATQTALSTAAAAETAIAWAPAASMVSLASFGANSVPAMAGITATSALSEGLAMASMAGFESGGYTGNVGTSEIAGVVHGQEFVVNAAATARNRDTLEAMNSGASSVSSNGTNSGSGIGGVSVSIENYGTSKDFEVQQLSESEVRIIARDEAKDVVKKETPSLVAGELRNPNSRVSKSLGQSTKTERRR